MPDKPPVKISATHKLTPEGSAHSSASTSTDEGVNNAASNGYWVHDEAGPKHYVAPPNANGLDLDESDLVARLAAALEDSTQPDASRVHVALEKGVVILSGIVVSEMESQMIGRTVQSVAGEVTVSNQLAVDDALKQSRETP